MTSKGKLLRPTPRTHQEIKPAGKAPAAAEDILVDNVEITESVTVAPEADAAQPAK